MGTATIKAATAVSIHTALDTATLQLQHCSASPRLDAEVLLAHLLNKDRSHLRAWPEEPLSLKHHSDYQALIKQRCAGQPVAYLTGQREFWSLNYRLSKATLIPRPETEHLVELALQRLPEQKAFQLLDLGTGPGTIALAVAHERPRCQVLATDRCPRALQIAADNATRLGINNVTFQQSDWFSQLAGRRFELITANPPYVRSGDPRLDKELRFEPRQALQAGPDGLEALAIIIDQARHHLHKGGWLLLEHGYDQGPATIELLHEHGYREVATFRDFAGHDRNAIGRC